MLLPSGLLFSSLSVLLLLRGPIGLLLFLLTIRLRLFLFLGLCLLSSFLLAVSFLASVSFPALVGLACPSSCFCGLASGCFSGLGFCSCLLLIVLLLLLVVAVAVRSTWDQWFREALPC